MLIEVIVSQIPVLLLPHDVGEIPNAVDIGAFIKLYPIFKGEAFIRLHFLVNGVKC
jgi:hypothetical protein